MNNKQRKRSGEIIEEFNDEIKRLRIVKLNLTYLSEENVIKEINELNRMSGKIELQIHNYSSDTTYKLNTEITNSNIIYLNINLVDFDDKLFGICKCSNIKYFRVTKYNNAIDLDRFIFWNNLKLVCMQDCLSQILINNAFNKLSNNICYLECSIIDMKYILDNNISLENLTRLTINNCISDVEILTQLLSNIPSNINTLYVTGRRFNISDFNTKIFSKNLVCIDYDGCQLWNKFTQSKKYKIK